MKTIFRYLGTALVIPAIWCGSVTGFAALYGLLWLVFGYGLTIEEFDSRLRERGLDAWLLVLLMPFAMFAGAAVVFKRVIVPAALYFDLPGFRVREPNEAGDESPIRNDG